jgi:hypothetical protein
MRIFGAAVVLLFLFATDLWLWLGSRLHVVVEVSSIDTILDCVPTQCSSQVAYMYVATIVHTLHSIWIAHNTL